MLIIKIHYGLGNQLFQYAFGRSLSLRKKIPFFLDVHFYRSQQQSSEHPRLYQLDQFNIKENIISDEDVSSFINPDFWQRRSANLGCLIKPYYKRRIVYERGLSFDKHMWEVEDDVYLAGYWQDLRYFADVEDVIRKDLSFKNEAVGENKEMLSRLLNVESVGIHVRRGDYLTDEKTIELAGVADLPYYNGALSFMNAKLTNPQYFVFTDDPDWVRTHFDVEVQFELVTINGQDKGYEDLHLLSHCRHQVISNSSFGWWGAWLNNHPGKIVVAPKVWRKNGVDMFKPEAWTLI
jgi:hypothetical protein